MLVLFWEILAGLHSEVAEHVLEYVKYWKAVIFYAITKAEIEHLFLKSMVLTWEHRVVVNYEYQHPALCHYVVI